MRTLRWRIVLVLAVTACGSRDEPEDEAGAALDSAAVPDSMAGMPGMKTGELTLTAQQVSRGRIRWAPADSGTEAALVPLPGRLVPNEDRTARLGAPASGRVTAVLVRPGDRVAAGRILVTLQSPEAGMAQSQVAHAEAELGSKHAEARYAAGARQRAERLLALKSIPRQEYERAIADEEQARTAVAQAEAEVRRARSTAEQLGASATGSGIMEIRTPRAGVVLARSAVPGAVVEAGAPLAVVTDPSALWLVVNAPESAAGLFRVGAPIRFVVPAFPADTFRAPIDAVGAGLDSDTRTLPIRVAVPNPAGRLKPEMLATVLAGTATGIRVAFVPADAVQLIAGNPTVFVATPDSQGVKLEARTVKTGLTASGRVAIVEGLSAGELVVVEGAFTVKAQLQKSSMPEMEM
jgi:cobalt-zinc-cadmium efflux system membrane fusion protein